MLNDLNRWTVGWIDWNLLLDEQGGPNHVGNYCSAPVLVTQHGQLQHQPSYWFLGHVARFVPPGSCRVVCSSSKESLMVSAFVDPKGGKVVVALNLLEEDLVVELMVHHSDRENAFQRKIKIPGRSMLSCCLA
jgi:glucosylceramidase